MTMRGLHSPGEGEGAAVARVRSAAPDPAQPALSWLLSSLAGHAMTVELMDPEAAGTPPRPVLTATHLLLPAARAGQKADGAASAAARANADAAGTLRRAAVAHAAAHLLYSPASQPVASLKPMGLAVVSAIEDTRVERVLAALYPGVRRWFRPFIPPPPDPTDLGFTALARRMCRLLMDPALRDDNHWVNKARDLFEAQAAADLADVAAFRRLASLLANDLGQMRVRFNPLQYVVPVAYRDDNSYLWDYGEAVEPPPELALGSQGAAPQSREAAPDDAQAASDEDAELGRYDYPEWDYRLTRSRPDWCTVIERLPGWRADAPLLAGLRQPRLVLPRSRRLDRARRLRRQWEGDDIDLNAAIEVMIDRRLDLAPDARFFSGRAASPASVARWCCWTCQPRPTTPRHGTAPPCSTWKNAPPRCWWARWPETATASRCTASAPTRGRRCTTTACWTPASRRPQRRWAASRRPGPAIPPAWARRCAMRASWRCARPANAAP